MHIYRNILLCSISSKYLTISILGSNLSFFFLHNRRVKSPLFIWERSEDYSESVRFDYIIYDQRELFFGLFPITGSVKSIINYCEALTWYFRMQNRKRS